MSVKITGLLWRLNFRIAGTLHRVTQLANAEPAKEPEAVALGLCTGKGLELNQTQAGARSLTDAQSNATSKVEDGFRGQECGPQSPRENEVLPHWTWLPCTQEQESPSHQLPRHEGELPEGAYIFQQEKKRA